jgi:hypothetical protein
MQRLLGIVVIVSMLTSSAAAQSDSLPGSLHALSTKFIIDACKENKTEPPFLVGNCWGQIQALYVLASMNGLADEHRFCPPKAATIRQAMNIVVRHIEDKKFTFIPFMFAAIDALKTGWPCR